MLSFFTKRRAFSCIIILALFLMCLEIHDIDRIAQASYPAPLKATWRNECSDFKELLASSDLVVRGVVTKKETQLRCDMVFTSNYFQIKDILWGYTDNNICEVVQTGGSYKSIVTPPIAESEILQLGKEYILLLDSSPNNDPYGDYYIISGSEQGIIDLSDDKTNRDSFTLANLESLYSLQQLNNIKGPVNDSLLYWNDHVVYFYYEDVAYPTYVTSAFNSWNYNGGGIVYSHWNNPNAAVNIMDNNYGYTSWIGTTSPYTSGINLNAADVRINEYFFENGFYTSTDYLRVVCHEAGHALGYFMHNEGTASSIMRGSIDDVIAEGITAPTSFDFSCIWNMYYSYFY